MNKTCSVLFVWQIFWQPQHLYIFCSSNLFRSLTSCHANRFLRSLNAARHPLLFQIFSPERWVRCLNTKQKNVSYKTMQRCTQQHCIWNMGWRISQLRRKGKDEATKTVWRFFLLTDWNWARSRFPKLELEKSFTKFYNLTWVQKKYFPLIARLLYILCF